jgi:hypothetical protein
MFNPFKNDTEQVLQLESGEIQEPCQHVWNLFAKTFAPAVPASSPDLPQDLLEKILFGVTTYMWECLNCGMLRKQESLGSDENQLFEILERASKDGIQYVEYNNNRFGIALVPKDENPVIPLR